MSFNVSTSKAMNFIKQADGKQNPYSSQKAQTGDGVTKNEAAKHLVDLQNGEGGSERALKGGLMQTIMSGNGGEGYFDQIAALDGVVGSISDKDMTALGSLDGDKSNVTAEDFKQLKQQPAQQKQQKAITPDRDFMIGGGFKNSTSVIVKGMTAVENAMREFLNSGDTSNEVTGKSAETKNLPAENRNTSTAPETFNQFQTDLKADKAKGDAKRMVELKAKHAEELKQYKEELTRVDDAINNNMNSSMKMVF